jgi:uncharacterized protein (DUF952 family)
LSRPPEPVRGTWVFHIVAAAQWDAALSTASYLPVSFAVDGFVHLSHRHQVAGAANRYYRDQSGLVVVQLDPALLGADLIEEDLYDVGETFPHLYCAVPTDAAVAIHPLRRDGTGNFYFSV